MKSNFPIQLLLKARRRVEIGYRRGKSGDLGPPKEEMVFRGSLRTLNYACNNEKMTGLIRFPYDALAQKKKSEKILQLNQN